MEMKRLCNVEIHYGGSFKLVPESVYEDGLVEVYERIELETLNMEWLNEKADQCRVERPRRYYIFVNKGFVFLGTDKAVEKFVRRGKKTHGSNVCLSWALKVNDNHFQISVNEFQYNVSFEDFSCTCRRWQLSGIPCSHALCEIGHMRYNPLEYVHAYYGVETYKKVYAPVIFGINGKGLWGETNFIPPLPPNWGMRKGMPKHVRRRAPDEPQKKVKNASKRGPKKPTKSRRMQTTLKCSFCKLQGHNAKTCQIKKAKEIEQLQEEDLMASEEFANANALLNQVIPPFFFEKTSLLVDQKRSFRLKRKIQYKANLLVMSHRVLLLLNHHV